jgi:hypothetical protein
VSGLEWVDEVKIRAPLEQVAGELGMECRARRWSPCPACGADRRSGSDRRGPVVINNGRFRCFGCSAHGDAVNLVRHATAGTWPELRAWFARFGWCSDAPDAPPVPKVKPRPPPPRAPDRPATVDEVRKLWSRCRPVCDDAEVRAWLAVRGVDAGLVEDRDLARVLSDRIELPWWALHWRPGHRLVLPMFGADGELVALRARAARENADRKTLAARGKAPQAVYADGTARAVLAGEEWTRSAGIADVVVVEGDVDFLIRATWTGEVESAPPVIGVPGARAWPAGLADRIPAGWTVHVDEHDDDEGRRLTEQIAASLAGRCAVVRHRPSVRVE